MSKGSNRRPGTGYAKNYHGAGKAKGGSWVQVDGKMVPRGEYVPHTESSAMIMKPLDPFVSPVTQELITDRSQLRRHNKKHGITNSADYSPEFLQKRSNARDDEMTGNTKQAKSERVALIHQVLDNYGVR